MKNLFANNERINFVNFSFDVLTSEELAVIRGGKEADVYVQP